jgi:hypothetical protein
MIHHPAEARRFLLLLLLCRHNSTPKEMMRAER